MTRILPGWLPTKSEGIGCRNAFPILLGHVGPSDVITISDGRQGADSGSAGHKGNGLNNNKMEGLARLEVTFENLRSHMKPLGTTRGSA